VASASCVPDFAEQPNLQATIRVSDLASLRAALLAAAAQRNTVIAFAADITNDGPTLNVQGRGTVIDLKKHAFVHRNHNTGLPDGAGYGMVVQPTLSDMHPNDGRGILCNPRGTTLELVKALKGDMTGWFAEPAPMQYADEKLRYAYSLSQTVLVPAENITIKNGVMKLGDPQAVTCLYASWARGVTFQNLTFDYAGVTEANCNVGAVRCSRVRIIDVDFGGRYCGVNSVYDSVIRGCRNGGIAFEEGVQKALVEKCDIVTVRTNDVSCRDVIVQDCMIDNPDGNYGDLALAGIGGNSIVRRNKLLGCSFGWVSWLSEPGSLLVEDNVGLYFNVYRISMTGITIRNNSWQKGVGL
jgi:hypothetical protein